ncbi:MULTISPECIES: DUF945 family protein [Halomonadaceae]|uniref:DUF945 family protein n=1 Tax=Halomonadaceae TaxID=28256 RepID=UPI0015985765|nr:MULTISPECIES: DUF945 family protein [Halomonas]QJQ96919.1 DUF945 family protein [Halomonas sp. PA5]
MRKGKLVVVALGVLGVGYLAAQAYSSTMFERELSGALENIKQRQDVQVSRAQVSRGWFISRGEVHLVPLNGDEWRLVIPYTARHGLLATRAEGAVSLTLGEAGEPLFGERVEAPMPRWAAEYRTLEQTFQATLHMAPFEDQRPGWLLAFGGTDLTLEGRRGDMTLSGQVAAWQWSRGSEFLAAGPLVLESQYRYDGAPGHFLQRDDLHLSRLSYRQGHGPAWELDALSYRGETKLGSDSLDLTARLSLGEARLGAQPILAGQLDLALTRIDADGVRALADHLRDEVALLKAEGELDAALLARLEPYLLDMLIDSPRLVVESLRLASPVLDMQIALDGALTFTGDNVEELSLRNLDDPIQQQRWRSRLNGHFICHDLPLLVSLQLGLPLDTTELSIDVIDGEVWLNQQAMPSLF